MANNNDGQIVLGLDIPKTVSQINADIKKLQNQLEQVKATGALDTSATVKQINAQITSLQSQLKTIELKANINTGNITNQSQQVGQQIGNNIAQGVQSGVAKANSTMESFSRLTDSMKSQNILFNNEGLQDIKLTLDEIKKTYSEFGQVKITNQTFNLDELQSFKVNIEQVNGELKETRSFMMSLSNDKTSFVLPDDVIKGTEKYVQHLNTAKNVINATGEEANALKQKLAEQEKYYGNIKKEINTLYSLKTKLLSADELETAELERQIKSTKQRISYNYQQIDKKGISDNSFIREINDLDAAKKKQLALVEARSQDSANAKAQTQAQKELNATLKEQQSLASQANKIQLSFANGDYEAKVESTVAKTQQWRDENGNARISTEQLRTALANLGTAYNNLNDDGGDTIANQKALKQAESELSAEIKRVTNEVTKMNAEYAKSSKVESFNQKLTEFYDKNTATHRRWGNELEQMMDATAYGAKITNSELINMERRFTQIGNEARQAGKLGLSLFDSIKEQAKKFTQWVSVTSVLMEGVQTLRKMKDAVYDIDTAMTSLYKVTDETDAKYNKFLNSACDNAQRLGRSVSSLVEQTANWAKLGYGIDDASKLAEISSIYANVGEVDDATAVSDIVIALKSFNIEAENSIDIVDKLNNLGNKYATSSADLGEGLSKSASALALAGNDIDKTLAMLTGGTEITQNASEMGNALKVLSMRIRGKICASI